MKPETEIDSFVTILKALANKQRLEIIRALSGHERNVRDLAKVSGLSQSAVSQHLGRLRHSRLVTTRRDAQTVYYSLNKESLEPLYGCLQNIDGRKT